MAGTARQDWEHSIPAVEALRHSITFSDRHPTVKPVAMVADALRDCLYRKGIVLDAFVGSGHDL